MIEINPQQIPDNPKFINLIGQKFNMLTVVAYAGRVKKDQFWFCECDCGNISRTKSYNLKTEKAKSCGCMVATWASQRFKTHGNTVNENRAMYRVWRGMLARCGNEKSTRYQNYGGRGIKVCDRWMDFKNFLADMGDRPDGLTIDRIDVNGNYEPGNCRWADLSTQANNKTNSAYHIIDGEKLTVSQWAAKRGVPEQYVYARLHRGWSIEDALLPADAPNPKGVRNSREHTPESLADLVEAMERNKRR
jgi:hypothetical protein